MILRVAILLLLSGCIGPVDRCPNYPQKECVLTSESSPNTSIVPPVTSPVRP